MLACVDNVEAGKVRMRDYYARQKIITAHEFSRHKTPHPECELCELSKQIDRNAAAGILTNAIAGIFSPAPAPKGFLR